MNFTAKFLSEKIIAGSVVATEWVSEWVSHCRLVGWSRAAHIGPKTLSIPGASFLEKWFLFRPKIVPLTYNDQTREKLSKYDEEKEASVVLQPKKSQEEASFLASILYHHQSTARYGVYYRSGGRNPRCKNSIPGERPEFSQKKANSLGRFTNNVNYRRRRRNILYSTYCHNLSSIPAPVSNPNPIWQSLSKLTLASNFNTAPPA